MIINKIINKTFSIVNNHIVLPSEYYKSIWGGANKFWHIRNFNLDVVNLGLGDVLLDANTGEIYVPNTNSTVKMSKNTEIEPNTNETDNTDIDTAGKSVMGGENE